MDRPAGRNRLPSGQNASSPVPRGLKPRWLIVMGIGAMVLVLAVIVAISSGSSVDPSGHAKTLFSISPSPPLPDVARVEPSPIPVPSSSSRDTVRPPEDGSPTATPTPADTKRPAPDEASQT